MQLLNLSLNLITDQSSNKVRFESKTGDQGQKGKKPPFLTTTCIL